MRSDAFLGTGWSFPPSFDKVWRAAALVSGELDVHEALHILLATTPGERVMHPSYGCGLKRLVFANIDQSAITEIRDTIEQAVLFFEPRVTLDLVDIDTSQMFDGVLRIGLDYTLRTTNTRHNIVYPFYFKQGTALRERA
ncbi:MAG: GPW/gp25 family protein [Rubrivivax sp.]|nr:GPW/gp25 family protein [Rubrivivax sp.]